jgi:hypothetical protein
MIQIRKGIIFENPELRIREYCEIEIYRGYDDKHSVNNIVTEEDIKNANRLYAMINRYNRNESSNLLRNTKRIENVLKEVPEKELFSFATEEWSLMKATIEALLTEFLTVDGIGLAKATKILHLKRPNLFPVLDRYVMMFLLGVDNSATSKSRQIELGIEALEVTRTLLVSQKASFVDLTEHLKDLPITLTPVRIFDILCWSTEKWDILEELKAPYGTPHKSLFHFSV